MLRQPFSLRSISSDPCFDLVFGESVIIPDDPVCHFGGAFAFARAGRLAICECYTCELFAPLHLALDANCPARSIMTHAIDEFPNGMTKPSGDSINDVRGLKNPGLEKPIVPIFCFAIVDRLPESREAECDSSYVAVILWMVIGGPVERCGIERQHSFDKSRLVFFCAHEIRPRLNSRRA